MKASRILTLIFFAFIIFIIVYSFQYSERARFGPLVIGIPVAVLVVTQIIRESFIKKPGPDEGQIPGVAGGPVTGFKESYRSYLEIAGCLVGLLVTIYLFGLLIGFALFIIVYLKLHHERWPLSIGLGLGIPAFIYSIFSLGLKMMLYKGIVF